MNGIYIESTRGDGEKCTGNPIDQRLRMLALRLATLGSSLLAAVAVGENRFQLSRVQHAPTSKERRLLLGGRLSLLLRLLLLRRRWRKGSHARHMAAN